MKLLTIVTTLGLSSDQLLNIKTSLKYLLFRLVVMSMIWQEPGTGLVTSGHRGEVLVARHDWVSIVRMMMTTDLVFTEEV